MEYALLLSLICVVAIPAVIDLGTNTEGTLTEVATSIEEADNLVGGVSGEFVVGGSAGPPMDLNGGPIPFAQGTGWHAVDINEPMVLPAHASGSYQIYTVWTSGLNEGSYYMNYFQQNEDGSWTQYPPGVDPRYPADLMAGGAGEWVSFYDIVPWLPGSNYPPPGG